MNPAALRLLRGGLSGGNFTASNSGIRGYNTASTGAYNGTYPYLDMMKAGLWYSGSDFSNGTPNADNWVTGIPDGHHYDFPIVYSMGNETGYFPPGDYEAVCSNANLTIDLAPGSAGITAIVPGAGTCTFTVGTTIGLGATFFLTIRVANSSGSPQDCLALRVNLVSNSSLLLAGHIIDPAYVAAYSGAKSIRMHDISHFDSSSGNTGMRYFSDFNQTLSKRNYSGDNGVGPSGIRNGMVPIAVMCELADKVGARPWFNMHTGMGQYIYTYDHATNSFSVYGQNSEDATSFLIPHRLVDGEKLRSYSFRDNPALGPDLANDQDMYVINPTLNGGKSFQLSATHGGSVAVIASSAPTHTTTGTITNGSNVITAIGSMTDIALGSVIRATQISGGFGIVTVISGSTATIDPINGDNNHTSTSGATITVNGNLGPAEFAFSAIASLDVDLENDMIRPYMEAIKTYMDAHPTLAAPMFEPSNEIWNFGFPSFRWFQKVASIFATGSAGDTSSAIGWFMLKMWSIAESVFGSGNFTIIHPGQGANFGNVGDSFEYVDPGIRNAGQKVKAQYITALAADVNPDVPSVVYAYAMYLGYADAPGGLNGDVFGDAYAANGNDSNIPNSYWDDKFAIEIAFKVGTSAADLVAVAAKVPNIKSTMYEWGQQISSGNVTDPNMYAVALNYLTYMDSVAGATIYDNFWQQVVIPNVTKFYTMNHYSGIGNRSLTYQFVAWPICDSRYDETICQRAGWYKLQ